MSYSVSAVAFKGDRSTDLAKILESAGLKGYVGTDEVVAWTDAAALRWDAPQFKKPPILATVVAGWTLVPNEKLAEVLLGFVRSGDHPLGADITFFAVAAHSTVDYYSFGLMSSENHRYVSVSEGEVSESGSPLECERAIVAEDYGEDEVLEVMSGLGIDFESGLEASTDVRVYRHPQSRIERCSAASSDPSGRKESQSRPWWKFW